MSVFGKVTRGRSAVRCDGCGIISSSRDGYYVRGDEHGSISNRGRDCAHDFCERCEPPAPLYACSRCGTIPDGSLSEVLAYVRLASTMIIHTDSHVDHNLTTAQQAHIFEFFGDRRAFFIATIELPLEFGTVPCGLHGPLLGDAPIADEETTMEHRGTRAWPSRLVDRPARQVRTVTVIAGPHDGRPCVLFTAFGGPLAPQEPGDPGCKDPAASAAFWREHALSRG